MEEKVKLKKVGFKTLGITLIVFGVLFLLQAIFKVNILKLLIIIWPVILIALGTEILVLDKKYSVKLSIGSMFLIGVLVIGAFILGVISYVINNIVYSDEILSSLLSQNNIYYLNDENLEELVINNYTDNCIGVKIIEDDTEDTKIIVDANKNEEYKGNNIALLLDFIDGNIMKIHTSNNSLQIYELSDYIGAVNLKVITKDKNLVKVFGNYEIMSN